MLHAWGDEKWRRPSALGDLTVCRHWAVCVQRQEKLAQANARHGAAVAALGTHAALSHGPHSGAAEILERRIQQLTLPSSATKSALAKARWRPLRTQHKRAEPDEDSDAAGSDSGVDSTDDGPGGGSPLRTHGTHIRGMRVEEADTVSSRNRIYAARGGVVALQPRLVHRPNLPTSTAVEALLFDRQAYDCPEACMPGMRGDSPRDGTVPGALCGHGGELGARELGFRGRGALPVSWTRLGRHAHVRRLRNVPCAVSTAPAGGGHVRRGASVSLEKGRGFMHARTLACMRTRAAVAMSGRRLVR